MTEPLIPGPTPELVAELAAWVDAAANETLTAYELSNALQVPEAERAEVRGRLHTAFTYREHGRRGAGESFFAPMFEFNGHSYPPALQDVDPADASLWAAVGEAVESPVARARLNDLCFEARWGHGGGRGRAAANAYLEMSAIDVYGVEESRRAGVPLGRVDWLGRALEVASKMGDQDLVERAVTALVDAANESLAQPAAEPGVSLGALEVLVDWNRSEVEGLLVRARERYVGDAWNTDSAIELQLRRAGSHDETRTTLQRERVITWIDHAERGDAILRMHFLEGAIQLARDYGFSDLVDRITSDLQAIDFEDLDLKRQTYEFSIPSEVVEEYIGEFLQAETWQDALRLLTMNPPSGDAAANRKAADEILASAVFVKLLPTTLIGGDGLPRLTITTEDQKREKQLVDHETLSIRTHAPVLHTILVRIWDKWGPIPVEDIAAFLGERGHVRPTLATALARSLVRFFNGDIEGAIFTATPRIEALVRELVLAAGSPVYRTQRANSPGQYPGLGALLPELRDRGVDESWVRYLNALLASPMGDNARNELLHGFWDEPPETLAALVLVGALFLAVRVSVDPQSA